MGNGLPLPDRGCQSLEAGLSGPSRILPDLSLDLKGVALIAALGSGLATEPFGTAGTGADVGVEACCCAADTGVRARLMVAEGG